MLHVGIQIREWVVGMCWLLCHFLVAFLKLYFKYFIIKHFKTCKNKHIKPNVQSIWQNSPAKEEGNVHYYAVSFVWWTVTMPTACKSIKMREIQHYQQNLESISQTLVRPEEFVLFWEKKKKSPGESHN